MKFNILKFLTILFLGVLVVSCGDDEYTPVEDYGSNVLEAADAFLNVNTPVVSFQAGTPSYDISLSMLNGKKKVTKINMYSVFTDGVTLSKSNEVVLRSIDVGSDLRNTFVETVTYDDLKAGLTIDGGSLPADEVAVAIGSGWLVRFEGETAEGTIDLPGTINVAVLSRFAGLYEVVESGYYRINVASGTWNGTTRFIGSVDETTFSYNDNWGNFGWAGNSFNFKIDFDDNTINVPLITGSGLFSGSRAINCTDDNDLFVDVPCEGSNVLIANDETGKHEIRLTYGYFTDGSGSRQFYEVLRKL